MLKVFKWLQHNTPTRGNRIWDSERCGAAHYCILMARFMQCTVERHRPYIYVSYVIVQRKYFHYKSVFLIAFLNQPNYRCFDLVKLNFLSPRESFQLTINTLNFNWFLSLDANPNQQIRLNWNSRKGFSRKFSIKKFLSFHFQKDFFGHCTVSNIAIENSNWPFSKMTNYVYLA